MKVLQLQISNFRGISSGVINLQGHTLLVGDQSSGKTTICDALRLILGRDTLKHYPILDEYDYYNCLYLDSEDQPVEIRLKVILTDLSAKDQLRFKGHLRAWNDDAHDFADSVHDRNLVGNGSKLHWVLPVVFIGRYDKNERDFVAGTFFDYPLRAADDGKYLDQSLGDGRIIFGRADKRHCGFIFLGSGRTTAQLLSLRSGSLMERLIDFSSISLAGDRVEQPAQSLSNYKKETALPYNYDDRSRKTHPLSAEAARYVLENVPSGKRRNELRETINRFVQENLDDFDPPVDKRGSGATGLMLIDLLKSVLELKESVAVNLVIEQPEDGLPPHKLEELLRLIISGMSQVIVTTNATAVTEQFGSQNIVVISRCTAGNVCAAFPVLANPPIEASKLQHRQLATAILGNGALVVNSDAAAAAFREASIVLQKSLGNDGYTELTHGGISIIQTGTVDLVPLYGPMLKAINKKAFAFYGIPAKEFNDENTIKLDDYTARWELAELDLEALLISETIPDIHRRFLEAADELEIYPRHCGTYDALLDSDGEVSEMAIAVLRDRKDCSDDMTGLFIRQCRSAEALPVTIRSILLEIHRLNAHDFAQNSSTLVLNVES